MIKLAYAGVALAALIGGLHPASVSAATTSSYQTSSADQPKWVSGTSLTSGGERLVEILRRSTLDGFKDGLIYAGRAEGLAAEASAGNASAAFELNRMLSAAWVQYVEALSRPAPGMAMADPLAAPNRASAASILRDAASAPSLVDHLEAVSAVNPIYRPLRDAAWADLQLSGGDLDPRIAESLDRARHAPLQSRYIMVDAASAKLWMIENGQIAGEMKVITGDADNATPMIASAIRQATLNPYWNVPRDLIRTMIAPRVIEQGVSYLTERDYEVFEPGQVGGTPIDPATIDWTAVETGSRVVHLRRKPGQWNSMGRVKFGFANDSDIFLHDTPNKELFNEADRNLSHGCIRLADAPRLTRWLLGREPDFDSAAPEQQVALPAPVPIYITYLTAHADGRSIAFVKDVYGHDGGRSAGRLAGR